MTEDDCRATLPVAFSERGVRSDHGALCDCRLLAAATHARADAIAFSYCRHVLQKRYAMTCRHGDTRGAAESGPVRGKWRGLGEIDAVKAILVANG